MIKRLLILILLAASFTAYPQTNNFKWLIEQPWTTSGTDTYTTTISGFPAAYATGMVIKIKFANANTGSSTLNINSLGAKTLKKSGSTNLASGDISAGQEFEVSYDGTNFQVFGIGGAGGGGGTTETASNGLTKVVNDIQLGGSFTAPIVLTGSSTNTLTFLFPSLGTTITRGAGLFINNPTAAAAGAQQHSFLSLGAQGWKTNATAGTQSVIWDIQNLPVQGAANPTSSLIFSSEVNGAATNGKLTLNSNGSRLVSFTDGLQILTNGAGAGGLSFNGAAPSSNTITHSTGFQILQANGNWSTGANLNITSGSGSANPSTAVTTSGVLFRNNFTGTSTSNFNLLSVDNTSVINATSTGDVKILNISPTYTAAGGNVYGIYYGPTTSVPHIATMFISGNHVFGHTSLSSTVNRMELRGIGTTTGYGLILRSSSGTDNFGFRDDGKLFHFISPANDNALTDIIVRDGATGELKYRTVASLPGGGISNTAANNELMKSNGTNAIPSGLFSAADGYISLGGASTSGGGWRDIAVAGSETDIGIELITKGDGGITLNLVRDGFILLDHGGSGSPGTNNITTSVYTRRQSSGTVAAGFGLKNITAFENNTGVNTEAGEWTYKWTSATNGAETLFTGYKAIKSGSLVDYLSMDEGNIALFSNSVSSWQSMERGFFVANALSNPTGNPTGGGFLFADAGDASKLKYRVPGGTVYDLTSGGGTYYAPSSLAANATDADFTAVANSIKHLPAATLTANRTITIPTGSNGDVIELHNNEAVYVWNLAGATVYLADRTTVVTQLLYNVPTLMQKINGLWIIKN